jgi:hypothetical protein
MLNIRMSRTPIEGSPLTEEFETQEVREQSRLYICQVLHVGLKPINLFNNKLNSNTTLKTLWSRRTVSCRMHAHVYVYIL